MSKERLYLFYTTFRDEAQKQINPFAEMQTDKLIVRKNVNRFAGMQTDKLIVRRNSLSAAGGEV